jgi:hypothetical protein
MSKGLMLTLHYLKLSDDLLQAGGQTILAIRLPKNEVAHP